MDNQHDPELAEERVPWREGNREGYMLLDVIKRPSGDLEAITVRLDKKGVHLLRWTWHNLYGRNWSPDDGAWNMVTAYVDMFDLTYAQLKKLVELVEKFTVSG